MWHRRALVLSDTEKEMLSGYTSKDTTEEACIAAKDIMTRMGDSLPPQIKSELLFTTNILSPLYKELAPTLTELTGYITELQKAVAETTTDDNPIYTPHHKTMRLRYCELATDVCQLLSHVVKVLDPATDADTGNIELSSALWRANAMCAKYYASKDETFARLFDMPTMPPWVEEFIATIRSHTQTEHIQPFEPQPEPLVDVVVEPVKQAVDPPKASRTSTLNQNRYDQSATHRDMQVQSRQSRRQQGHRQ